MPLNFNGRKIMEQCLPDLLQEVKASPVKTDVWIIDNHSEDDSKEFISKNYPDFRFVEYPKNEILRTYNHAAKECLSKYILILNNDMKPQSGFIAPLLKRMQSNSSYFSVSPKVLADEKNERYLTRRGGRFFHGHLGMEFLKPGPGACLYLHGGAALIDREKFLELGGFDSMFFYMEDNDLSYRSWMKGWPCIFEPSSEIFHLGSQTVSQVYGCAEKKRALKEKASHLFILKNIRCPSWWCNYIFWTFCKAVRMCLSFDPHRAWAFYQVIKNLPQVMMKRRAKASISDPQLMKKIKEMSLPDLN